MADSHSRPEQYWHCLLTMMDDTNGPTAVVNDLSFSDLQRLIVEPWHKGVAFPVAGIIVRSRDLVREIRISHTPHPKKVYSDQHYAESRGSGVIDLATDTRLLPIWKGVDHTHELLFQDLPSSVAAPDVELILQLCRRLPATARVLATRDRKTASV